MYRTTARVLAVVIGLLGLIGIFIEGAHLLDIINVDMGMDVLRLAMATVLGVVGFGNASARTRRTALGLVGGIHVLLGLIAIADREVLGLAPNEFTEFDIALHLVLGLVTLAIAARTLHSDHLNDSSMRTSDDSVHSTVR